MAKRKAGTKKKGVQIPERRKRSGIVRWWRRNAQTSARIGLFVLGGLVVVVGAYLIITTLGQSKRSGRAGAYITEAREALLRSDFEAAQVAYHQARNIDPDDPALRREQTMFQQRLAQSQGGSTANAIAAANTVVAHDSSSTIGNLVLAQLYNARGDQSNMYLHAARGLQLARSDQDKSGQIMAGVLLGSHFRQRNDFDSAYYYSNLAVELADETLSRFYWLITRSGLAYSALGLDSLAQAESLLRDCVGWADTSYAGFAELAQAGLADYFRRAGQYDSALNYANLVLARYPSYQPTPTEALAAEVAGQALTEQSRWEEAEMRLHEAAALWRKLAGYSDLITTYNALGDHYYRREDYVAARKYYLAATRIAAGYGLEEKGQYDINLNNFFLDKLSNESYLSSGAAAEALADSVIATMEAGS